MHRHVKSTEFWASSCYYEHKLKRSLLERLLKLHPGLPSTPACVYVIPHNVKILTYDLHIWIVAGNLEQYYPIACTCINPRFIYRI
jgi:hypothetical protein